MKSWKNKRFFSGHIRDFLKSSIIEGKKILIVSYGEKGSLLNAFNPYDGIELVDGSQVESLPHYPNITFIHSSFLDFQNDNKFDYIIFQEYLNYEDKLYELFKKIKSLAHKGSKIFVFCMNPHSLFVIRLLKFTGLLTPKIKRNILFLEDLENLASICGFDIIEKGYRFFCPFKVFDLGDLLNFVICRIPFLRYICFGQFLVFRLFPDGTEYKSLSASVVIPCYNEEDNIRRCIESIPEFGAWREIIVVDDGSQDNTRKIVEEMALHRKDVKLISYGQNKGKGYAVSVGWENSKGDVLMMLDCDMTTPAQELPLFHDIMENGAEFISGTRLVYPREKNSIPFFNRLGVSLFAAWISWLVNRRITDTFCGTKVFLRQHRACFKIKEYLWGDWDLFFSAARYRLKMVEFPVHFKARRAGKAKMRPIKHGLLLLKASLQALKIIK